MFKRLACSFHNPLKLKHCVLTKTTNTETKDPTDIPHSEPLTVKVKPTFLNGFPASGLYGDCTSWWKNIPKDPRLAYSSPWPSTVSSFLWASSYNCAKYQQDVSSDTLTFQLSPSLSHKDALVLSETEERMKKRWRMKKQGRINIYKTDNETPESSTC